MMHYLILFFFLAIIYLKQMGSPGVGLFFRYYRLIPEWILSGSPRSVTLSQMWKANWAELCRHDECGSQAESSPVGDTAHRSHSSGGVYRKGCIQHNTAKRSNVCEQSSSSRTIPSSLPLSLSPRVFLCLLVQTAVFPLCFSPGRHGWHTDGWREFVWHIKCESCCCYSGQHFYKSEMHRSIEAILPPFFLMLP